MLARIIGRMALGVPFIIMGYQAAKDPGGRVKAAEDLGLPDPELMVKINGASQAVGGAALATGILPRAAALGLAASLVPTTVAGHPFWEIDDPQAKQAQTLQFLKNLGLFGGLLAVAATPVKKCRKKSK